jgi:hypothetical protein
MKKPWLCNAREHASEDGIAHEFPYDRTFCFRSVVFRWQQESEDVLYEGSQVGPVDGSYRISRAGCSESLSQCNGNVRLEVVKHVIPANIVRVTGICLVGRFVKVGNMLFKQSWEI